MYEKYFGLTDIPFSIAPNPRYLYMSEQHHEALAHLIYGVEKEGGFILLTGEVGTGKTTVCRCFLEQLPKNCDVAFILNPKLSIMELLATICDELGIKIHAQGVTLKGYLDAIYEFLLAAYSNERKVLLIIDEAQTLAVDVLEQIRLLTNLETNRKKLLQIVLLGQPELRDLFKLQALRQLAQRITARYHLSHLSRADTAAYVRHRLDIAGCQDPIFPAKVIQVLHRYSGGIPRLINVLCDRALLAAYAQGVKQVNTAMMRQSIREVMGRDGEHIDSISKAIVLKVRIKLAVSTVFILSALGWAAWDLHDQPVEGEAVVQVTAVKESESEVVETALETALKAAPMDRLDFESRDEMLIDPVVDELTSQLEALQSLSALPVSRSAPNVQWRQSGLAQIARDDQKASFSAAFVVLLQQWGYQFSEEAQLSAPCDNVESVRLQCIQSSQNRVESLKGYNRPAIVTLQYEDSSKLFVVITELSDLHVLLQSQALEHRISYEAFLRFWTGELTVLWKNPPEFYGAIVPGTIGQEVKWLSGLLGRALKDARLNDTIGYYDEKVEAAVKQYQRQRGLNPDGIAGIKTMMSLSSDLDPNIPRLMKQ